MASDTFELMSRVRDLNTTAREQGLILRWGVEEEPGVGPVLRMAIDLQEDDAEFIRQMQALFAPIAEDDPRL